MQTDNGSASIQPIATEAQSEPIPVIASGAVMELRAPSAFTAAYSIRALGRAKRQALQQSEMDMTDALNVLECWKEPMDRAIVDVSYIEDGQKRQQSFIILGQVWGGSPPCVSSYDASKGQVAYEHTPGIVATIDHVGVLHNE